MKRRLSPGIIDVAWLPLAALFLCLTVPLGHPLFLDVDEGYNLMRAMLYGEGYRLYSDIWYDQPPLLTVWLSTVFSFSGNSLAAARVMAALFALLFLGSFYFFVRNLQGRKRAFLAFLFLLTSTYFLRVSISIMETLPSLSLAMLSLTLLTSFRNTGTAFAAGAAQGLALQIKFNTMFLAPLSIWAAWRRARRRTDLAAWICGCAAGFLLTAFLFYNQGWQRIFTVHTQAASVPELSLLAGWNILPMFLRYDLVLVCLAFAGLAFYPPRSDVRWVPLAWLAIIVGILLQHQPVWYHYYLLLSPPLCWLAADAVCRLTESLHPGTGRWLKAAALLFVALLLASNTWRNRTHVRDVGFHLDPEILQTMESYAEQTQWVVSFDRQIYPFMAGLKTPAELAVTSWKRNFIGELQRWDVMELMQRYEPEQVVLANNLSYRPELSRLLNDQYDLVIETPETSLFIYKPLKRP